MVYAFTGRRSPALSASEQALVAERLRKLLTQAAPSAVVGAAACGADLLVLEAALALHASRGEPSVHVLLPTELSQFREESVEPEWRARFDDVIAEVRSRGELREGVGGGDDVYATGNLSILERAQEVAGARGQRAVALVVATEGQGEYVERFTGQGCLRGIRPLRIDPGVTRAGQRRAFVVMPYGEKWDVQRGFKMNCDLTYGRLLVPALEHAQLHYRRADETVDPGIVLRPMIDDIAQADVVIADLATGNFNVGWELGLRHLLKDHTTILIKPAGNVPAPFDVQALRCVPYEHDESGFGDDAVLEAWAALDDLLDPAAATGGADNPVRALMDVRLAEIETIGHEQRRVQELRDELAEARDLKATDRVERVVAETGGLEPADARLVLAEAGTIMRRLGEHRRAQELLEPIVAADGAVQRPAAHQELALALYRAAGADDDAFRRAEEILRAILRHGGYPETESLLGAVAKRRARLLDGDARVAELQVARAAYRAEYERNLNDHYAGVNVIALGAVLAMVHGDDDARAEVHRLLPAVAVAAELRLRQAPEDFWARATAAEVELLAVLSGVAGDDDAAALAAYRAAAAARPLPDEVASSLEQLHWFADMGLDETITTRAATALQEGIAALG